MPLITRVINNSGDPLCKPDGTLAVGAEVKFSIVTPAGVETAVFDAISGERICNSVTTTTNALGEFSVSLWPNDRGSISTMYLCQVNIEGIPDFLASVPTSDLSTLSWINFAANGTAFVPTGLGNIYVQQSLATAANDFLVASDVGQFVAKTLAQVKALINVVTSRYIGNSTDLDTALSNVDDSLASLKGTGFIAWTSGSDATTYSIVGGKFQLDRAGYGEINGKKISWTAGQQTGVLAANTFYFIYIDSSGMLQTSTTFPANTIRVYEALYDGTNYFIAKENHPVEFLSAISGYLHNAVGTIIYSTGANITRVASGTGASADDRKIKIVGADTLSDHGLNTTISDSAGVGVTIAQMYRNGAGKWVQYVSQSELAPYYNNAGTPTALNATPNTYSVYVIYAKKDDINTSTPGYFAVMNETAYSSLALAQAAITAGTITYETNELKSMEGAQLGYAIVQYSATGGYITELQIAKSSLSQQFIGAGVGASGNHALQSNLDYASSGHTGFASTSSVTTISNRTYTTTSTATLTLDYNTYNIGKLTAQAASLTIANPTGSFLEDDPLLFEIKDNGTARAIAFGDQFVNRGATKPTTTVAGKWMRIACIRNATTSTWDVLSVINEA